MWFPGIHDLSYEPPPHEAALPTLLRSGSVAGSLFCTSAFSAVPSLSVATTRSRHRSRHQGAHWPPEFYADFTSRVWITYLSHFYPIRDSSLTVLKREQAGAAAAGVQMPPISSSPLLFLGGLAAWGGGRMMLVGVVYCEQVSRRLRQLLYIYI